MNDCNNNNNNNQMSSLLSGRSYQDASANSSLFSQVTKEEILIRNNNEELTAANDLLNDSYSAQKSTFVSPQPNYNYINNYPSSAVVNTPMNHPHYVSEIEAAILRSNVPIQISGGGGGGDEEIVVNGQRGVLMNKNEIGKWKGLLPIDRYPVNQDSNPEVVTKRTDQQLHYIQELAMRYLRPPTPPPPGEIVITQESNTVIPPAPPIILRQQPPRPVTPEPLVIREAPPQPPAQVGRKVITISGKSIPPAPRKVIIERLAPLPTKPQSILVERWLPYAQTKRRVIFQRSAQPDPTVMKPRNVIVQWEAPKVQVKREYKYLGVVRANPADYVAKYGATLKRAEELPQFVLDLKPQPGVILAADYKHNNVHELVGDVGALNLVDLDREGLSQYKYQVQRWRNTTTASSETSGYSYIGIAAETPQAPEPQPQPQQPQRSSLISNAAGTTIKSSSSSIKSNNNMNNSIHSNQYVINSSNQLVKNAWAASASSFLPQSQATKLEMLTAAAAATVATTTVSSSSNINCGDNSSPLEFMIEEIFYSFDKAHTGKLPFEDAEQVLIILNSRLGKTNTNNNNSDVREFFSSVELNNDGMIDLNEFKRVYNRLIH